MTPLTITAREVGELIGKKRAAAQRLLNRLKADGLKQKGNGCGTCYDRQEFFEKWQELDTRE